MNDYIKFALTPILKAMHT